MDWVNQAREGLKMSRPVDRVGREDSFWTPDVQAPEDRVLLEEIRSCGGYVSFKQKRVRDLERGLLRRIMTLFNGNISLAARELKMDRSNLLRKLREVELK